MTSTEHNSGATCVVHGDADFARAPRASQPQVWGRVRLVERKRHAAALGEFSRAPPLPAATAVVCSTAQETLTVLARAIHFHLVCGNPASIISIRACVHRSRHYAELIRVLLFHFMPCALFFHHSRVVFAAHRERCDADHRGQIRALVEHLRSLS